MNSRVKMDLAFLLKLHINELTCGNICEVCLGVNKSDNPDALLISISQQKV
jgi:hypothetical protein